MVRFYVCEDSSSFWDKKSQFIELYNDGVLTRDIRCICELSISQFNKLVRECADEGSIVPRRKTVLDNSRRIMNEGCDCDE